MRVVVAEDDMLVREGVVALVNSQDDMEVVGSASDLGSLMEVVDSVRPDVVLTDVRMPPTHSDEGIRAALELGARQPDVGVVVLSQYDDPEYPTRLFAMGTDGRGYLLKERVSDPNQLAAALRAVGLGGSHVDPKVVERMVASRKGDSSPLRWLTERELEVLATIAQGLDNSSIADALGLSVRSIEKHINSIFAKLGLTDAVGVSKRVAAVLVFLEGAE